MRLGFQLFFVVNSYMGIKADIKKWLALDVPFTVYGKGMASYDLSSDFAEKWFV